MPLLKPPDPKIPTRKYYVRIEEPVALTMERYAEFLGTTNVEHVVTQALEFVFRKDTDFKEWLAQHPEPGTAKANAIRRSKAASNRTTEAVATNKTSRQEEVTL